MSETEHGPWAGPGPAGPAGPELTPTRPRPRPAQDEIAWSGEGGPHGDAAPPVVDDPYARPPAPTPDPYRVGPGGYVPGVGYPQAPAAAASGYAPPTGYAAAPGYAPGPGYGPGYAPGPGYPAAPGYEPPPGAGPPAFAPPPGFGEPAGYGPPTAGAPRPGRARVGVVALVAALLGGLVGGGVVAASDGGAARSSAIAPGISLGTGNATTRDSSPTSIPAIAARLLPSVVTISVKNASVEGTGSGVVIRKEGYILTNNHVAAPAASPGGTMTVLFTDSKDPVPATIVGRDPTTDLAVIKVAVPTTPAVLGQSSSLVVGDSVVAIGAPLGLSSTVTSGIVSALNRTVDVPDEQGNPNVLGNAIQTDAAINPGNSGGALVDNQGQVIGINSAIASIPGSGSSPSAQSGSIGVGFAIPIDEARSIAEEIIRTGRATHPFIGVNARTVSRSRSTADGLPVGAFIADVVSGGPADTGGLQRGDVITKIDAVVVDSSDALVVALRGHRIGDRVTVTYVRDKQTRTASVTLTERKSQG